MTALTLVCFPKECGYCDWGLCVRPPWNVLTHWSIQTRPNIEYMFQCNWIPVSLVSVDGRVSLTPLSRTGSSFCSSLTVHQGVDVERAPIRAPSMGNNTQSNTSQLWGIKSIIDCFCSSAHGAICFFFNLIFFFIIVRW